MNYSKQRELVFQTVLQNPIHPTADAVYEQVRRENPKISLGTVYRNLNFLSEMGMLRKHYHMACTCCGRVFDVECGALEELDHQLLETQGFQVQKRHLLLTGLCKDCQEAALSR